jgi:Short C-terminal domain/Phospholipase_D-nuclease N-terminal
MPLADSYSYPVLGVFWTILELFAFVVWIWLLFWIFADIFRSQDLSGVAKTLWVVVVLFLPLFGILAYLIVRGGKMHERAVRSAQQQDEAARAYIRDAAGPGSTADQLTQLADLRDRGVISAAEFEREKAKVLAAAPDNRTVPDPRAAEKSTTTT